MNNLNHVITKLSQQGIKEAFTRQFPRIRFTEIKSVKFDSFKNKVEKVVTITRAQYEQQKDNFVDVKVLRLSQHKVKLLVHLLEDRQYIGTVTYLTANGKEKVRCFTPDVVRWQLVLYCQNGIGYDVWDLSTSESSFVSSKFYGSSPSTQKYRQLAIANNVFADEVYKAEIREIKQPDAMAGLPLLEVIKNDHLSFEESVKLKNLKAALETEQAEYNRIFRTTNSKEYSRSIGSATYQRGNALQQKIQLRNDFQRRFAELQQQIEIVEAEEQRFNDFLSAASKLSSDETGLLLVKEQQPMGGVSYKFVWLPTDEEFFVTTSATERDNRAKLFADLGCNVECFDKVNNLEYRCLVDGGKLVFKQVKTMPNSCLSSDLGKQVA